MRLFQRGFQKPENVGVRNFYRILGVFLGVLGSDGRFYAGV